MINRRSAMGGVAVVAASALAILAGAPGAEAANKVLKIGFVGVTSGPAAAWGTSNVRSMQTRADWLNEKGGVKIGPDTYDIVIVTFDDQKDPKRAIAGMEKMAQEASAMSSVRMSMTARPPCVPWPRPRASSIFPTPFPSRSTRRRHRTLSSAWSPAISRDRRSTSISRATRA